MGLEEAVKCESITEAPLGQEANFSCDFLLHMDVLQVTWQKINGSSIRNIATYSRTYGLRLQESFQRKARLTVAALNTSAITLQNLTSEDTSCYRCIFNVFPYGSFSSPDLCLKIQNSGNANNPEVKMLVMGSPSMRGIQKIIGFVVVFIGALLATLILLIMGLIKRRKRRLQKHRAHRTPEKEEGLQEDVSEQSVSLETPKVQGSAYQNERQTPGSILRKRQPTPMRYLEEKKERETWRRNKRLVFSEEAGSQDSTSHNIPQGELTALSNDELLCTLLKNNSDTEECEESELCPALATPWPSTGEKSAHQSPVARSPEEH
ncbi:uncharacterized protein LOC107321484 isoform X2 [Coturnix japonica]|uniref:uncharacterized protein LOC107321484 isoform X2 n=1 Tax=Coturnix japonica TaxID=93934 RepID=UPI000776D6F3|nr:uncharacterized protein LOC107321484 isoform X2 [Coturnix japonica]